MKIALISYFSERLEDLIEEFCDDRGINFYEVWEVKQRNGWFWGLLFLLNRYYGLQMEQVGRETNASDELIDNFTIEVIPKAK